MPARPKGAGANVTMPARPKGAGANVPVCSACHSPFTIHYSPFTTNSSGLYNFIIIVVEWALASNFFQQIF
jgi:hypothetical protein